MCCPVAGILPSEAVHLKKLVGFITGRIGRALPGRVKQSGGVDSG
jgi:hypothetical protein